MREGRLHLPQLYRFASQFRPPSHALTAHTISSTLSSDLEWWRGQLHLEFCGTAIREPPPALDVEIFVDASTSWGIGFVLDGEWLAWRFRDGWRCDGRDIGWGEMVAVELALRAAIAAGFSNCHLRLRSDNMGVVGALSSSMSRNSQQNAILAKIVSLFQLSNIWLSVEWVASKDNPADGPSRGRFPPREALFPFCPSLPNHLALWLHPAVSVPV